MLLIAFPGWSSMGIRLAHFIPQWSQGGDPWWAEHLTRVVTSTQHVQWYEGFAAPMRLLLVTKDFFVCLFMSLPSDLEIRKWNIESMHCAVLAHIPPVHTLWSTTRFLMKLIVVPVYNTGIISLHYKILVRILVIKRHFGGLFYVSPL